MEEYASIKFNGIIKETEKAYLFRMLDEKDVWFPKSLCKDVKFDSAEIKKFVLTQKGYLQSSSQTITVQKAKQTVSLVYNEIGFYDVFPKVSKSIREMRRKIIGVKGIKWQFHVILTYKTVLRDEILRSGGMSGNELKDFLNRTRTITDRNRKYFWKYEEGKSGNKPHFHLLFDFKTKVNKELIAEKLYRQKWKDGEVDIKKRANKLRNRYNRILGDRNDLEILLGMLLYKKWGKKGGVYVNTIKGLGKENRYNLIYYVNKDLMKSSVYNCLKKGANKWGFGKGYEFDDVEDFSSSQNVGVKFAIHKMMTTKQKFIEYYDSFGQNGYKLFFRKIRYMQQGKYFDIVK